MNAPRSRRDFLAEVGKGVITASVGLELATELGVGTALADSVAPEALSFGSLERLVCLMQETAAPALFPKLVQELHSGTSLKTLTAAAALANARTFGGEDYVGFHTLMAMAPAYHMSQELPAASQALPIFKVLYRNTNRIQEHGGRTGEVLHPVGYDTSSTPPTADQLREAVRSKDAAAADRCFAGIARQGPEEAFEDLLLTVHDNTEVHRVVLPYRAWDLLGLIGKEQAHTLLRQSVRYCVKAESWSRTYTPDEPRTLLPKMNEAHKLMDRPPGQRRADDAWVDQLSQTFFKSTPEQAADAAAAALAEGIAPADIGEALTLAANQLILRDLGRTPKDEVPGKPPGTVHGDSIGVHACDSANAWRNMALITRPRNCFASLILGAYQAAFDRTARGGDFLHWQPLPLEMHLAQVKETEPQALLRQIDEAIRASMQGHAAALVHKYGESGHAPRPLFDLMLGYAISEDGSLHAEKFYRTASEEFASTRPAFRWRHLVALARVTASEYGHPAAGMGEARSLLAAL